MNANPVLLGLEELRNYGGKRDTVGLPDEVILRFAERDPRLGQAVDEAVARHRELRETMGALLALDEAELTTRLQARILQFYGEHDTNPYVPLGARGPWMVTAHGAVLHDSGGYGMLGQGHAPQGLLDEMARPWVMANVMTPSFEQYRLTEALRAEVGHTRGACPFDRFLFMNSGSEAVTVALRIADTHARRMTAEGAPHAGHAVKVLSIAGSFHGRTDRPARASDSTRAKYEEHLHSFRDHSDLLTVKPNDVADLRRVFAEAEREGWFIAVMLVEPVMGEGDPGRAVTPEFYRAARELTRAHGGLLLVDSIQAGLRATGELSLVDYPGFRDLDGPDMETWSKALNGGQYPLSVLGLTEAAASIFVRGTYGNTMTGNPRAMAVAVRVLESLTPELRANVAERGRQFVEGLQRIADEFPEVCTGVQGTGLLFSLAFQPGKVEVVGPDGLERWCRLHGLGVIHGGPNSLRFTPHFGITAEEADMMLAIVREGVAAYAG